MPFKRKKVPHEKWLSRSRLTHWFSEHEDSCTREKKEKKIGDALPRPKTGPSLFSRFARHKNFFALISQLLALPDIIPSVIYTDFSPHLSVYLVPKKLFKWFSYFLLTRSKSVYDFGLKKMMIVNSISQLWVANGLAGEPDHRPALRSDPFQVNFNQDTIMPPWSDFH